MVIILVRIFPHSDRMRRDTEYLYLFSPNAGKCGPEHLQIQTLFTQYLPNQKFRSNSEPLNISLAWNSWKDKNDIDMNILIQSIGWHTCIGNKSSYFLVCNKCSSHLTKQIPKWVLFSSSSQCRKVNAVWFNLTTNVWLMASICLFLLLNII